MNKFKKFITFLNINNKIMADFHNFKMINDDIAYVRLVPEDYNITDIPLFKHYCKISGFVLENHFDSDPERSEGYCEYHDCYLKKNENFLENILEEL